MTDHFPEDVSHHWRVFRALRGGSYWKCINCGQRGSDPLSLDGEQDCPNFASASRPMSDVRASVAETLRTIAEWVRDESERDMFYATAETVEAMEPDDISCGLCEEVVCDDGCPLRNYRDEKR